MACGQDLHAFCAKGSMPTFRVWQARQLVRRDFAFGVFLFLVSLIYLHKTLPELCSVWADCSREHQQLQETQCSNHDQWPLLRRFVCGPTSSGSTSPSTFWDATQQHIPLPMQVIIAATALVKLPIAVLSSHVKGASTYFTAGLLSRDPLHLLFPPLCTLPLLLLLLPLPYPNVAAIWQAAVAALAGASSSSGSSRNRRWVSWYRPDHYWQHPTLRNSVVLCQRLLQYIAAAGCVSLSGCQYLQYSQGLRYWRFLGKYAYQGWVAYMLVLPLRLQLMVSCLEWCIGYSTTIRLAAAAGATSSSNDGFTSFLQQHQLPVSILLTAVLPTLGVMWLEKGQKKRFQQLQNSTKIAASVTAAEAAGATSDNSSSSNSKGMAEVVEPSEEQQPQLENAADSVNRCDSAADLQPSLASTQHRHDHFDGSSSSVPKSLSSGKKNLRRHRSAASGGTVEDTCFDASVSGVTAALVTAGNRSRSSDIERARRASAPHISSSRQQFLDDIRSSLQLAANHTAVPYTSEAPAVPGQAGGNQLSGLVPAVSSLLASEAAEVFAAAAATAAESQPGGLTRYKSMADCLPVSVKVHTNHSQVSSLGPLLGSTLAAQLSPHRTDTAPLQVMTAAFPGCVQLLASVIGLKDQPPHSSSSSDVLARSLIRAAQGCIDGSHPDNSSSSSSSLTVRSEWPDIDVAVGGSSASTYKKPDCSCSTGLSVRLQYCDPVCLVADQDQEIRLSLRLSGLQQQQPGCQSDGTGCQDQNQGSSDGRLLVFCDAGVVLDADVDLTCQVIKTSLTGQPSGVLHLALLPGKKPTAVSVAPAIATGLATQQQQEPISATAAPAAPLLLLPLLVLPQSAAAELQQYAQQLAAGDAGAEQAWETVAAVSVDVAYILAACQSAAAAAAAEQNNGKQVPVQQQLQQLPSGVKDVLRSVLVHSAAHGLFNLMQFVVQTAAAIYTSAPKETAAEVESSAGAQGLDSTALSSHTQKNNSSSGSHSPMVGSTGADSESAATQAPAKHVAKCAELQPPLSGHSPTGSRTGRSSNDNVTPVASSELLWGFRDPALEARYQAAAFTSSGLLDFISFIFMTGLGLGCYSSKGPPAATVSSTRGLLVSQLAAVVATMSGPTAALLLRLVVEYRLRHVARQHHQARVKKATSKLDSADCSNSSRSSKCGIASSSQQGTFAGLDPVTAELARAARIKQLLLAVGMCLIPVWAVGVAVPGMLVTPGWVSKVMGHKGLSQELGVLLSTAMKGLLDQVPFSWFWKILTAHGIVNAVTSITHGLRPYWWPMMRYLPALLLALLVAARQQVQGRRYFCRMHGLQVA